MLNLHLLSGYKTLRREVTKLAAVNDNGERITYPKQVDEEARAA